MTVDLSCPCANFSEPIRTLEGLNARCAAADQIEPLLAEVASEARTWMAVLRCQSCAKTWVREYPFSELQGGGPRCYYQVPINDPQLWLTTAQPALDAVRRAAEDRAFLAQLGTEVGPELCRRSGCSNLRIGNSVLCRAHHFESIHGRIPIEVA
jgi:hypothetical protein